MVMHKRRADVAQASKKVRAEKSSKTLPPAAKAQASRGARLSTAASLRPPKLERLVEDLWLHQQELEAQNKALLAMQAELEASRDQYALLYDAAPVAYLSLDAAGRIHQCNLAAAQLLRVERAQLVGRLLTSYAVRSDASVLLAHLGNALQGAGVTTVEIALRKHEGERTFVRLESGPLQSSSRPGPFCLTAMVDVTQTRKLNEERERIERKLQETQRLESLGVLAGGIAHDFNNLLAAILGRASLGSMVKDLDPVLREHFGQIELAAERAADLCKQMMSYSGRGEFSARAVDLNELVRSEERLLRSAIHHGARIDFDLTAELPPVQGDSTQLRQLLMNLVINASESCGHGDSAVRVRTRSVHLTRSDLEGARVGSHLPEGDYVAIEVSDNGEGMSAATLEKIFEPFFSTKFAGRGLGLAVVLGIVRRHSAALQVDSVVGGGTTFRCWLPLAKERPVDVSPSAEARAESNRLTKIEHNGTFLLVDDDDAVRETAALMLKSLGFDVLAAASGEEALALFALHQSSVRGVLMDLSMPEMDGRDLFRALCREQPGVRVLLMSGFERREALRGFGRARPQGFLQKPLHLEVLRAALGKLLLELPVRPASQRPRA
jgi:PAS domain S-box-containing protein